MGGQTACFNWERMLAFRHARFDRQPRAIPTGAGLVQPAALERAGSSSAQDRTALRCLPQGQPDDAGDDRRSSSAASGRLECLSLRPAPIVVRLLSQPQKEPTIGTATPATSATTGSCERISGQRSYEIASKSRESSKRAGCALWVYVPALFWQSAATAEGEERRSIGGGKRRRLS